MYGFALDIRFRLIVFQENDNLFRWRVQHECGFYVLPLFFTGDIAFKAEDIIGENNGTKMI